MDVTYDPRIDDKIAKAPDFARPILTHFRALVHASLDGVEEAVKWGMPHFTYKGKNLAGMAAFKAHCAIMIHGAGRQGQTDENAGGMGSYGKIASLADMPDDAELATKLREARDRIDTVGRATKRAATPRSGQQPASAMPDDFAAALASNELAKETFDGFPPSQHREYLDWISVAKRSESRAERIAQAVEWLADGKRRNWKYER